MPCVSLPILLVCRLSSRFTKPVRSLSLNGMVLCLILHPTGEQLYEHFDKVCVIYEDRMAYFGPASSARQYFIDMGFEPAHRQTTADFLVAVTDQNGRIIRSGFESRTPRTASEFAERFLASPAGDANRADMDSYRSDFVGKPDRALDYKTSARARNMQRITARRARTRFTRRRQGRSR